MSEILVNTIKKADGTGSITVPAETGTVVTTAGASFTADVSTTAQFSTNAQGSTSDPAYAITSGSIGVNGMYVPEANGLAFATGATERARFNSGTGLLIGTTNNSPAESSSETGIRLGYSGGTQFSKAGSEVMRVNRNTNDGRIIGLCGQAVVRGEIAVSGTTIQYTSFSDHRLKENVTAISDGIGLVKTLNPVNFDWIETSQNVNGFLAHEVQAVVPEAVTGTHNEVDDDGNPVYQGIDQSKLVPLLTAALQEAIAKIETLETTVADLQTRVTALEGA